MSERFEPLADTRPDDSAWPDAVWPPSADTRLVGNFVELRRSESADAAELFAALDDEDVWRHVAGRPRDAAEMAALIAQKQQLPRQPATWRVLG